MTIFGWILVAALSWCLVSADSNKGGRIVCLAFLIGILIWGTGIGL